MNTAPSADEKPKRRIAKQVVSEKRQYFVPAHGRSVSAKDADEAVTKAKKASAAGAHGAEKVGDE
jgi:hypothetical protein